MYHVNVEIKYRDLSVQSHTFPLYRDALDWLYTLTDSECGKIEAVTMVCVIDAGQGVCPKCEADLEYAGTPGVTDIGYDERVTCPECGWSGYEIYREVFEGHGDETSTL